MLNELINASQALLQAEIVLNVLEYSSDQKEYDKQFDYVEIAKKDYHAIAWIPQDNLIEWYTLNVLTEYNGLDLTRLDGNYLMMIHYSK